MQSVMGSFVIPPTVYEQAMKKAKSRNPKFHNDFLKQAATVLGVTVDELQGAIDVETARRERAQKQQGAKSRLETAIRAVQGVKLPAALARAVSELSDICGVLELHCDITVSPEGTLTTNVANSELSSKSVISPWLAYEKGQKMGDTFKVERVGNRHWRNPENGEEFTNLTGWIRTNHPDSHAAAVLKRYGQL
jgi:hypothetical protein